MKYKSVLNLQLSDEEKTQLKCELKEFYSFWDNIKRYTKEVLNSELVSISSIKIDEVSINVIIDGVESNVTINKIDIRDYKIKNILQ